MNALVLYVRHGCGACDRVLIYLKKNNIAIPLKNISDNPIWRDELIAIGGKSQTPCLVINGVAMYESLTIIDWLTKNAA